MGSCLSSIALIVTWCFCTATGSLLNACLGNDKASTVPPGANSGRRRSVLLLVLSILIAFGFKYGVAPFLVPDSSSSSSSNNINSLSLGQIAQDQATNFFEANWLDGCEEYYDDRTIQERCVANSGVYRSAASATLFFLLAAFVVVLKPSFNREVWPAKYVMFLFLTAATIFVPNDPWFGEIYMNIARVGGVCFIFLQQLILLDVAYNWNDSWVEKSNEAEAEEAGSGQKWLGAILVSAVGLFVGSLVAIILLFVYFSGCPSNNAFISLTLVWAFIVPAAQLSGEEGSLLSSAVTVTWATYLCFSAVSKNPDGECNPRLGSDDITGMLFGLLVTMLSLGWTAYSWTAGKTLHEEEESEPIDESAQNTADGDSKDGKVTGVVLGGDYGSAGQDNDKTTESGSQNSPGGFSNSWKLNVILAVVSCWFAMTMTSWGSISSGGNDVNPNVGNVTMWMIMSAQWVYLSLYLWTLTAPRLFPDRDFS